MLNGKRRYSNVKDIHELLETVPAALAELLRHLDDMDAAEIAAAYLDGDETERIEMLAFVESDGPRRASEIHRRNQDGTPTAADLEAWLGDQATT
tara:strand:+ start:327 stop:611 length:285 start_codon:yes stop_codon:yes gene_type:complete